MESQIGGFLASMMNLICGTAEVVTVGCGSQLNDKGQI